MSRPPSAEAWFAVSDDRYLLDSDHSVAYDGRTEARRAAATLALR